MRPRAVLAGALAAFVSASLFSAGLLNAPPASALRTDIVELDISFAVKNTNRTSVSCASDGKDYTVNGVLVGPKGVIAAGDAATLYLHAVTWNADYFNLDIPEHNYAQAMAQRGHVSVAVDRLGYGTSGKPEGRATCFGSEADVAAQMVDALKSGNYTLAGRPGPSYDKVFLGGSSVGALIANIAAFSFHNVDGLINQGFGDFAASVYAGQEVADAFSRCSAGGDAEAPPNYATFARNSRDTFYFQSATPDVRAATPPPRPDPCGQLESVPAGIGADMVRLGEIDVPVLLLFGASDAVFPPPALELTAPRYSGSPEVVRGTIPGASHFPVLERGFSILVGTTSQWLENQLT
jgi:pimeloyl-ACP methyl ester carboxylesterase